MLLVNKIFLKSDSVRTKTIKFTDFYKILFVIYIELSERDYAVRKHVILIN